MGSSVYFVLPKYNIRLGPTHSSNVKYLLTANVEALYVMMRRELIPVERVSAGNIFAIKGEYGGALHFAAPKKMGLVKTRIRFSIRIIL